MEPDSMLVRSRGLRTHARSPRATPLLVLSLLLLAQLAACSTFSTCNTGVSRIKLANLDKMAAQCKPGSNLVEAQVFECFSTSKLVVRDCKLLLKPKAAKTQTGFSCRMMWAHGNLTATNEAALVAVLDHHRFLRFTQDRPELLITTSFSQLENGIVGSLVALFGQVRVHNITAAAAAAEAAAAAAGCPSPGDSPSPSSASINAAGRPVVAAVGGIANKVHHAHAKHGRASGNSSTAHGKHRQHQKPQPAPLPTGPVIVLHDNQLHSKHHSSAAAPAATSQPAAAAAAQAGSTATAAPAAAGPAVSATPAAPAAAAPAAASGAPAATVPTAVPATTPAAVPAVAVPAAAVPAATPAAAPAAAPAAVASTSSAANTPQPAPVPAAVPATPSGHRRLLQQQLPPAAARQLLQDEESDASDSDDAQPAGSEDDGDGPPAAGASTPAAAAAPSPPCAAAAAALDDDELEASLDNLLAIAGSLSAASFARQGATLVLQPQPGNSSWPCEYQFAITKNKKALRPQRFGVPHFVKGGSARHVASTAIVAASAVLAAMVCFMAVQLVKRRAAQSYEAVQSSDPGAAADAAGGPDRRQQRADSRAGKPDGVALLEAGAARSDAAFSRDK